LGWDDSSIASDGCVGCLRWDCLEWNLESLGVAEKFIYWNLGELRESRLAL
jgi:hypothetical protein